MRAGAGSFRTPSGPAVGFFVDGSSIDDLNGVYARLERAPACLRDADLVYKNDDNAWHLARADAGGAAAWVFVLDCVDRFGDEYHGRRRAPGEGGDFEHLYRPRRALASMLRDRPPNVRRYWGWAWDQRRDSFEVSGGLEGRLEASVQRSDTFRHKDFEGGRNSTRRAPGASPRPPLNASTPRAASGTANTPP